LGLAQHQKLDVKQIVPGACGGTCASAIGAPSSVSAASNATSSE